MGRIRAFFTRNWEGFASKLIYDIGKWIFLLFLSFVAAIVVSRKWDFLGVIPRVGEFWASVIYLCMAVGAISILYRIGRFAFAVVKRKGKQSRTVPAWVINAHLMEKPHECTFCGLSYSVIPDDLDGDKVTYIKEAKCPHCGNVDVVSRVYGPLDKLKTTAEPFVAAGGATAPKKQARVKKQRRR
jgi:hypothetical protein